MQPQIPIDVNEDTGIWTTDGLPMLYVPRHFFINNHVAVEAALGRDRYAEILYQPGHRSAWYWCAQEAKTHGLSGLAVFEHYLKRLSQRGWGLFEFMEAETETATARIALRHSAFVLQQPSARGKLCYMFAGWFAGALDWVCHDQNHMARGLSSVTISRESSCAAEGHEHCTFEVKPK